jgi:hypothetical protein
MEVDFLSAKKEQYIKIFKEIFSQFLSADLAIEKEIPGTKAPSRIKDSVAQPPGPATILRVCLFKKRDDAIYIKKKSLISGEEKNYKKTGQEN